MQAKIYTKRDCSQCVLAKNFLKAHNISIHEIIVGQHITREELLEVVPTAKTVPQIFINGTYVGGFLEMTGNWTNIMEQLVTENGPVFLAENGAV